MTEPASERIIEGDCVRAMRELPAGSVDLVFADPPYFLRLRGELHRPNNTRAHAQLVDELRRLLGRIGLWSPRIFAHTAGVRNTTHQCGTLCFGTDPRQSVLDPFCRSHDVDNLFAVDASFFPSSAAVNPGLTIVAQALRVADHIRRTDLR